jgi:hypothetical protein
MAADNYQLSDSPRESLHNTFNANMVVYGAHFRSRLIPLRESSGDEMFG